MKNWIKASLVFGLYAATSSSPAIAEIPFETRFKTEALQTIQRIFDSLSITATPNMKQNAYTYQSLIREEAESFSENDKARFCTEYADNFTAGTETARRVLFSRLREAQYDPEELQRLHSINLASLHWEDQETVRKRVESGEIPFVSERGIAITLAAKLVTSGTVETTLPSHQVRPLLNRLCLDAVGK